MMRIMVLAVAITLGACRQGQAQTVSGPASVTPATVGLAPSQVVPSRTRGLLAIDNESANAAIACAFGSTVPALNSAGSWTIGPGLTRTWVGPKIPSDAVSCIASNAGTPVTIEE